MTYNEGVIINGKIHLLVYLFMYLSIVNSLRNFSLTPTSTPCTTIFNSALHVFKMSKSIWFWHRKKKKTDRKTNPSLQRHAQLLLQAWQPAKKKKTVIAHGLNISRKTIDRTIKWFSERHDFKSRPCTGHGIYYYTQKQKDGMSHAET